MLLKSYRMELFNNECMPSAMTIQCFAHLDHDVSTALLYLNASQRGDSFTVSPPSITFHTSGILITIHGKKIEINALKDEEEADKILGWLKREINIVWENCLTIWPF